MIHVSDICSLTDFQRNAKKHLARLHKTGRPEVLTVNGKAELVVQSAETYLLMIDQLERAATIAGIAEGLDDMDNGRTIPLEKAMSRLARKYEVQR